MRARLLHRDAPPARTDRDAVLGQHDDEAPEGIPLRSVYVVLDAEASQVKIGISANVPDRLRRLSRERGRQLELIGTMRGGYDLERAMHGRFRPYRRERYEWYSAEILGELTGLLDDV